MIYDLWSILPIVILIASTLALLLSQNWRWSILALAVQYLGIFWLVTGVWPIGLAAVKLVVGWMAGAVLGASRPSIELIDARYATLSGRLLRLAAATIAIIFIMSIAPMVGTWIPAGEPLLLGGLILIGMGVLQLGLTTRPLAVILGLFTTISGFEVLYAAVESSVLVAGLLAMVNLGLAMVGAYALLSPAMEEAS